MTHAKRRTAAEPQPVEPRPAGMQAMGETIYRQIRQVVQELAANPQQPG